MKGRKEFEDDKYRICQTFETSKEACAEYKRRGIGTNVLKFTWLDLFPLEPTPNSVMEYLVESGWIDSMIIKQLGDACPYLDDYIQEIYMLIFDKIDKIIDIYENYGILTFCKYIKTIVNINTWSRKGPVYKKLRYFNDDVCSRVNSQTWNEIIDTYSDEDLEENIYWKRK